MFFDPCIFFVLSVPTCRGCYPRIIIFFLINNNVVAGKEPHAAVGRLPKPPLVVRLIPMVKDVDTVALAERNVARLAAAKRVTRVAVLLGATGGNPLGVILLLVKLLLLLLLLLLLTQFTANKVTVLPAHLLVNYIPTRT